MKKGILYINQFFAGIGGEDKADQPPYLENKLIGPGLAINKMLKDAEITHTVVCGDNFISSNQKEALDKIIGFLENLDFDFFIAGPAFQAGRYGVACGTVAEAVKKRFNVPVFTSMHEENPGADMFKKKVIVFKGGKSAASLKKDAEAITNYINRYFSGEKLGSAEEEKYFGRGIRHQVIDKNMRPASERAIEMLLKKLKGEEYVSELPIPKMEKVKPASPIKDLSKAKIALVTSSGIVPSENPDRIQSASATRWGMYDISKADRLEPVIYKTIHAGYDPAAADADPNVCVPLDALRAYEKEERIGAIDTHFYTTVGTGTTEAEAERMAKEIVVHLQEHNVDAVILTST